MRTVPYSTIRKAALSMRGQTLGVPATASVLEQLATHTETYYRDALQRCAWAELTVTAEVDHTNWLVSWEDVENADHVDFYDGDPRKKFPVATKLSWQHGYDGYLVEQSPTGALWASYVPEWPRFTSEVAASGTSYPPGTIKADSNGDCFKSLAADATGANMTNAAKWKPQLLLASLQDYVVRKVVAARMTAAEAKDAATMNQEAEIFITRRMAEEIRKRNRASQ